MKTLEILAALLLIAAATSRGQGQNAADPDPEVVRPEGGSGAESSSQVASPAPSPTPTDSTTVEVDDSTDEVDDATDESLEDSRSHHHQEDSRPSTGPPVHLTNDCDFVYHNLTFEDDGCVGHVPVASCRGYCRSEMEPEFFLTRRHAEHEPHPYRSNCKCCTNTWPLVKWVNVKMRCLDGRIKVLPQKAATALNCGCMACGGH